MRRKHVPTLCLIAPFCLACPTRSGLTTDSCWQHVPTFCLMTLLALHSSFKYIHDAKSVYLLAARITQQDMLHLFRKQQCRVDLSKSSALSFWHAMIFGLPWWQDLIPALRWSIDHEEETCSDTLSDGLHGLILPGMACRLSSPGLWFDYGRCWWWKLTLQIDHVCHVSHLQY